MIEDALEALVSPSPGRTSVLASILAIEEQLCPSSSFADLEVSLESFYVDHTGLLSPLAQARLLPIIRRLSAEAVQDVVGSAVRDAAMEPDAPYVRFVPGGRSIWCRSTFAELLAESVGNLSGEARSGAITEILFQAAAREESASFHVAACLAALKRTDSEALVSSSDLEELHLIRESRRERWRQVVEAWRESTSSSGPGLDGSVEFNASEVILEAAQSCFEAGEYSQGYSHLLDSIDAVMKVPKVLRTTPLLKVARLHRYLEFTERAAVAETFLQNLTEFWSPSEDDLRNEIDVFETLLSALFGRPLEAGQPLPVESQSVLGMRLVGT